MSIEFVFSIGVKPILYFSRFTLHSSSAFLFLSVTVICKSGIKADALSTAIFLMGLDNAIEFININNDIGAILITDCKEVYVSRNLKEKFHILDEDFEYFYC